MKLTASNELTVTKRAEGQKHPENSAESRGQLRKYQSIRLHAIGNSSDLLECKTPEVACCENTAKTSHKKWFGPKKQAPPETQTNSWSEKHRIEGYCRAALPILALCSGSLSIRQPPGRTFPWRRPSIVRQLVLQRFVLLISPRRGPERSFQLRCWRFPPRLRRR